MPPRDLEALAERCVPGRGPVEVLERRTGLAHDTYRVTRDGRSYSLRVAGEAPAGAAADRRWEAGVLESAASGGLAPPLRYADAYGGVLVLDWVDGRTWSGIEARQARQLTRIAGVLRRLHVLPIPEPARAVTPAEWVERYRAAGASPGALLERAAGARLAELQADGAHAGVLCHGDLHTLNVIDDGARITLLDFEYAHVSDPLWDVAGWSANNDFDRAARAALLAQYRGGGIDSRIADAEVERLDRLVWLYDYVCLLWSGLYLSGRAGAGDAAATIRARAAWIERRLRAAPSGGCGQVAAH